MDCNITPNLLQTFNIRFRRIVCQFKDLGKKFYTIKA
jgi:hypothetical protein